MTVEYRQIMSDDVELRAEGDGMSFAGYAIRYNSKSEPLPFREIILPGASTRSLKSRNEIKAFVNHNTDNVIGSTRSGTLRLAEDARGLFAEIDLPDTTYGRDLAVSVKRGDVSGMSFGFSVPQGGDSWNDSYSERTISELRLHEVSPVTGFPAYSATTASVRSLMHIATRCGEDAALLEIAVEALLMSDKLDVDAAALLRSVIDKMMVEEPPTVEMSIEGEIPLALLQKQLDLMAKAV